MDFFGFVTPNNDFNTPIGNLIRSATDALLLGPDWAKNIEICDAINSSRDVPEPAIKALLRRMQDPDQKVVSLSLVIAEACMKNCGQNFASFVTKPFMDEMVTIAKGSKGTNNQEDALRLIQQWGKAFQANRGPLSFFYDTYANLKSKGINFPPDEDPISFGNSSNTTSTSNRNDPSAQGVDEVVKLHKDLDEVFDKVRLAREMLVESPGIETDEALAEVIGYLEACRDRMVDLVEAGTQGLLGEELLALCLRANDAVLRTLEAEKNGTPIEIEDGLPTAQTHAASANSAVKGTGDKAGAPAMRTGVVDELDKDEFANLTLKTSSRRAAGATAASKPRAIAPPQQLVVPPLPAPPGSRTVNLLEMEDLLTGSRAIPAPAMTTFNNTATKPPPSDIDIFLATADSNVEPISTAGTGTTLPPNTASSGAVMSDADFDAFLSGISTK